MVEFLGVGVERSVKLVDESTVRVLFADRISPERLEGYFLLYTLAHEMFPESIPKPKSWGTEGDKGYVDAEKVDLDEYHLSYQQSRGAGGADGDYAAHVRDFYKRFYEGEDAKANREAFMQSLREAGFLNIRDWPFNFSFKGGKQKFLDFYPAWEERGEVLYDAEKLRTHIGMLEESKRLAAQAALERLIDITPKKTIE